jgi:hypothetical protein
LFIKAISYSLYHAIFLTPLNGPVQKRVMSIIYPNLSYDDSLALSNISKLSSRREEACIKLFNEIVNIPDHKLAYLLPPKQETKYDLRQSRVFTDYIL